MIGLFTGIIEEIGQIKSIQRGGRSAHLHIKAELVLEDVKIGDSIAVNGVCLTVNEFDRQYFAADVMPETMDKTTLGSLNPGSPVNLERAMQLGGRMGGHIVQGHVDATGTILQKQALDIAHIFRISAPGDLLRYVVPKGSITVDGVSLTVIDVSSESFTVSLIPHTSGQTILGGKKAGDTVNLESDILGRYIEKLLKPAGDSTQDGLDMNFLAENGFL
ncbi:MAG: riboflavin synthase [Deltaproteobacteria bacterium]